MKIICIQRWSWLIFYSVIILPCMDVPVCFPPLSSLLSLIVLLSVSTLPMFFSLKQILLQWPTLCMYIFDRISLEETLIIWIHRPEGKHRYVIFSDIINFPSTNTRSFCIFSQVLFLPTHSLTNRICLWFYYWRFKLWPTLEVKMAVWWSCIFMHLTSRASLHVANIHTHKSNIPGTLSCA